MATLHPYLNFDGNAEEAFNFYQSVFGGEFSYFSRFSDMPESESIPENERNRIMHISLPIGNGSTLMGSDIMPSMGHKLIVGNNFYISIDTQGKEEVDRIFSGLSVDGSVEMQPQDTFWGAYFTMFTDKFGIRWMINYDYQSA